MLACFHKHGMSSRLKKLMFDSIVCSAICIAYSPKRRVHLALLSLALGNLRSSSLPEGESSLSDCFTLALGNVLLSQNPAVQVPLALEGLTVVFEMGTRGSPPPSSPNEEFYEVKLTS